MAENLKAMVGIFVDKVQELETQLALFDTKRNITNATGQHLDNIGEIAGEPRLGRDDTEYRQAIQSRLLINQSSGTPEEMLNALQFLTQATTMSIQEVQPATVILYTDGTVIPSNLYADMLRLKPAGVELFIYIIEGGIPFSFDDEGGVPRPPEGQFFSEYNYTEGGAPVGGQFTEVIT